MHACILTSGVGEHAHQWGELRRASAVGNVQSPAGRAGDASGLRLLLLVHGGGLALACQRIGRSQAGGFSLRCTSSALWGSVVR